MDGAGKPLSITDYKVRELKSRQRLFVALYDVYSYKTRTSRIRKRFHEGMRASSDSGGRRIVRQHPGEAGAACLDTGWGLVAAI